MDENPRLTLRLPRDLWRVVAALRMRWATTNEGVVRRLISDAGGLPAPGEPRHSEAIPAARLRDSHDTLIRP